MHKHYFNFIQHPAGSLDDSDSSHSLSCVCCAIQKCLSNDNDLGEEEEKYVENVLRQVFLLFLNFLFLFCFIAIFIIIMNDKSNTESFKMKYFPDSTLTIFPLSALIFLEQLFLCVSHCLTSIRMPFFFSGSKSFHNRKNVEFSNLVMTITFSSHWASNIEHPQVSPMPSSFCQ